MPPCMGYVTKPYGPPRRALGRPGTGLGMTLEAPRPWSEEAPGGLPEAPRGPPRGAQEGSKKPPEHAGTRLEKTRQEGTRQEETTEDEDKRKKTREAQSDRSQHKIRQDKTRGHMTRGDQRGEVSAPKRRCFTTRFHKRTKGLSDPRRPQPLEPSTTYFSCI